jgi:hypothetical protein
MMDQSESDMLEIHSWSMSNKGNNSLVSFTDFSEWLLSLQELFLGSWTQEKLSFPPEFSLACFEGRQPALDCSPVARFCIAQPFAMPSWGEWMLYGTLGMDGCNISVWALFSRGTMNHYQMRIVNTYTINHWILQSKEVICKLNIKVQHRQQ